MLFYSILVQILLNPDQEFWSLFIVAKIVSTCFPISNAGPPFVFAETGDLKKKVLYLLLFHSDSVKVSVRIELGRARNQFEIIKPALL